jgi:hypothetical protein
VRTPDEIRDMIRMLANLAEAPKIRQGASVSMYGAEQALRWVLDGVDPDDAFSPINDWVKAAAERGIATPNTKRQPS